MIFTAQEKKAIIFLCSLLLLGGILRLVPVSFRESFQEPTEERLSISLKINVNKALWEELEKLPSIGKKTADNIIEYRNHHGNFSCLEDLMSVKGIGSKKLDIIKEFVEF